MKATVRFTESTVVYVGNPLIVPQLHDFEKKDSGSKDPSF